MYENGNRIQDIICRHFRPRRLEQPCCTQEQHFHLYMASLMELSCLGTQRCILYCNVGSFLFSCGLVTYSMSLKHPSANSGQCCMLLCFMTVYNLMHGWLSSYCIIVCIDIRLEWLMLLWWQLMTWYSLVSSLTVGGDPYMALLSVFTVNYLLLNTT